MKKVKRNWIPTNKIYPDKVEITIDTYVYPEFVNVHNPPQQSA